MKYTITVRENGYSTYVAQHDANTIAAAEKIARSEAAIWNRSQINHNGYRGEVVTEDGDTIFVADDDGSASY